MSIQQRRGVTSSGLRGVMLCALAWDFKLQVTAGAEAKQQPAPDVQAHRKGDEQAQEHLAREAEAFAEAFLDAMETREVQEDGRMCLHGQRQRTPAVGHSQAPGYISMIS